MNRLVAAVFFLALIFGWLLFDSNFSFFDPPPATVLTGSFLVFFAFAASLVSWGDFFRGKVLLEPDCDLGTESSTRVFVALLLGSFFFYGLSVFFQGLVAVGASRNFVRGAAYFLLAFGPVLNLRHGEKARFADPSPITGFSRAILVLLGLVFFTRLVEGLQISRQQDPYIVYLIAGRSWWDHLAFSEWFRHPVFFFSSSWESLYLWGAILYGPGPGGALDAAARFAHWTNSGIAFLGIGLGTYQIARKLMPREWALLAVTAALTIPSLRWLVNIAKGDIGTTFWGVGAIAFFITAIERKASSRLLAISGLLFGAMAIGKLASVMVALAAAAFLGFFPGSMPGIFFFIGGGLIGAAPILLRNACLTLNPVFPWFLSVFPASRAWMGEAFTRWCEGVAGGGFFARRSIGQLGHYLFEFLAHQTGALLFLPALLAQRFFPHDRRSALPDAGKVLFALALLSGGLYVFFFEPNPNSEIRYYGAGHVLWAVSGWFAVYRLFQGRARQVILYVSFVAVIALSDISFHSWKGIARQGLPSWANDMGNIGGYPLKQWLHGRTEPGERIYTVGDQELYFLSDRRYENFSFFTDNERAIRRARSPDDFVRFLRRGEARYFVDQHDLNPDLSEPVSRLVGPFLSSRDDCVVYREGTAKVFEVDCLAKATAVSR